MSVSPPDHSRPSLGAVDDATMRPVEPGREAISEHARTLRCRTVATGRLRQRHHIRHLEPLGTAARGGDEPSLLHEDEEPHPSELLLAALGACLTVGIQSNAVARGIPLRRLEVHMEGDVDPSALWGTGNGRVRQPGFRSVRVVVHVKAEVPPGTLKALVDHVVLWSPVANTLHDPVDLAVTISEA